MTVYYFNLRGKGSLAMDAVHSPPGPVRQAYVVLLKGPAPECSGSTYILLRSVDIYVKPSIPSISPGGRVPLAYLICHWGVFSNNRAGEVISQV